MNQDMQNYYNNTKMPWSKLYYRVVAEQLADIKGMKVLDFGSGFGIVPNILAENNNVTAIEPNADMVQIREQKNSYTQIIGDIKELSKVEGASFDVVICHNVLEYAPEREDIVREFSRILKNGGLLSIVKHHHAGRIMQKIVFENNIDEALFLLDGGEMNVRNFGKVNYYKNDDILKWAVGFKIEKVLGVRTFWALQQNNDLKFDLNWQDKMYEIEMKVSEIDEYKNISFFNHIKLRRIQA